MCSGAGKDEFLEEACWDFNGNKIHDMAGYLHGRWGCGESSAHHTYTGALPHAASIRWYAELVHSCRYQHTISLRQRAKQDWDAAKAQLRKQHRGIDTGHAAMEEMCNSVRAAARSECQSQPSPSVVAVVAD